MRLDRISLRKPVSSACDPRSFADDSLDSKSKNAIDKAAQYGTPIFKLMTKRVRPTIARGSAELAILALLEEQPLYGFEIAKSIEEKTGGAPRFNLASLYPRLCRSRGPQTFQNPSSRAMRLRLRP